MNGVLHPTKAVLVLILVLVRLEGRHRGESLTTEDQHKRRPPFPLVLNPLRRQGVGFLTDFALQGMLFFLVQCVRMIDEGARGLIIKHHVKRLDPIMGRAAFRSRVFCAPLVRMEVWMNGFWSTSAGQ